MPRVGCSFPATSINCTRGSAWRRSRCWKNSAAKWSFRGANLLWPADGQHGCTAETRPLAERFLEIFGRYDCVVGPSGSCVAMVRTSTTTILEGRPGFAELKAKTFEFCEFLTEC